MLVQKDIVSLGVNGAVLAAMVLLGLLLLWRFKAERNVKVMFLFYVAFWMPVSLLRPYAGSFWSGAGLPATGQLFLLYMAAYGITGVAIRWLSDFITFTLASRRIFMYFAIVVQTGIYVAAFLVQSQASLFALAVATGVGATSLGMFNLMAKEQRADLKIAQGATLFALPPLIGDFVAAPIQTALVTANQGAVYDNGYLKYLFIVGLGFTAAAALVGFFVRENRASFILARQKGNAAPAGARFTVYLLVVSAIGLFVTFAKFSTSGALATTHLHIITDNGSNQYEGYLNATFALGQVAGGVSAGFYVLRRKNKAEALLVGLGAWVVYYAACMVNPSGPAFVAVHAVNGFGYGIVYNIGTMLVLDMTTRREKRYSMGIYQTLAALGIAVSNYLGFFLKSVVYGNGGADFAEYANIDAYWHNVYIQYGALIAACVLVGVAFFFYSRRDPTAREAVRSGEDIPESKLVRTVSQVTKPF